jgi:hypothetical protein
VNSSIEAGRRTKWLHLRLFGLSITIERLDDWRVELLPTVASSFSPQVSERFADKFNHTLSSGFFRGFVMHSGNLSSFLKSNILFSPLSCYPGGFALISTSVS